MPLPVSGPPSHAEPSPRRGFLAKVMALVAGGALLARPRAARAATQGADPFVGGIAMFSGNFTPHGWAFCDGQL